MHNFFYSILIAICSIIAFNCCGSTNQISNYSESSIHTEQIGKLTQKSIIKSYNRQQFDSVTNAEKIPNNLELWQKTTFRDYETSKGIINYFYTTDEVKDDGIDDNTYKLSLDIKSSNDTIFILETRKIIR